MRPTTPSLVLVPPEPRPARAPSRATEVPARQPAAPEKTAPPPWGWQPLGGERANNGSD